MAQLVIQLIFKGSVFLKNRHFSSKKGLIDWCMVSDIFTNLKMWVPGLASLNFYESWSEFMSPTWRLSEIMLCGYWESLYWI